MKTPILFLIFNRPELSFRVFDEIRKAKPEKLFIAADGPREKKSGDLELCIETRKVIELVDWPCEINTLFRKENLGCKIAVSSAINWFFEHVEEGIILEDDCLPDQSFFTFCETLLEKYRTEEKIFHISGTNFQNGLLRGDASYYFSRYAGIWGWATWRRAWKNYDVDMKLLDEYKNSGKIKSVFQNPEEQTYWLTKFSETETEKINTWDYQWIFSLFYYNGISIRPNVNLISNIGIGKDPTHENEESFGNIKLSSIEKITHPKTIEINATADKFDFNNKFSPYSQSNLGDLKKRIYFYAPQWTKIIYKSLVKKFII